MWRNDVYEELELAGLQKIAARWLSCSDSFFMRVKPSPETKIPVTSEKIYVCSGNHHHDAEIYSQSCDLRICPDCARRHAARLAARYLPVMQELMHRHTKSYRFRHIMFSSPYALTDPDIREKYLCGFKQVYKVMDSLMSSAGHWKSEQGFLVTAEFGEQGQKLHYHVIHYGQYLKQSDLSRSWSEQTAGDACVVWVKGFPYAGMSIEDTLKEVLKYAVKFYSKDPVSGEIKALPPAVLPILAKVLEKTRRIRAYGLFFDIPEPARADHLCQTCGAGMVGIPVDYFVTFCNTGFLPLDWLNARTESGLNLKPADNSQSLTSGLAPPDSQNIRERQMLMAEIEKIRIQHKDDW